MDRRNDQYQGGDAERGICGRGEAFLREDEIHGRYVSHDRVYCKQT